MSKFSDIPTPKISTNKHNVIAKSDKTIEKWIKELGAIAEEGRKIKEELLTNNHSGHNCNF